MLYARLLAAAAYVNFYCRSLLNWSIIIKKMYLIKLLELHRGMTCNEA